MRNIIVYARQEDKLKELARKHKCKITIEERFNVYPSDLSYASEYEAGVANDTGYMLQKGFNRQAEYFSGQVLFEALRISIEADQDGNQVIMLGMVDEEGYVTTFCDSEVDWQDYDIKNVDMLRCDKCNTKHKRKKVFIVSAIAGEYAGKVMQVGGSCATQLDCEKAVKKMLKQVQWFINDLEKFEDDFVFSWGKGGSYVVIEDLDELFQVSASWIKKHGYTSYIEAEDPYVDKTPTGKVIGEFFDGTEAAKQIRQDLIKQLTKEEKEEGYWTNKVVTWLQDQEDSDYIHNAKIALAKLDVKKKGILISLVWMVIKKEIKDKEKAHRESYADELVKPVEGAKVAIEALVLAAKVYDGYYGESKGLTVLDKKYGKIFFKTTSEWVWDVKANDVVKGKITIKEVKDDISFAKTSSRKFEVVCIDSGECYVDYY